MQNINDRKNLLNQSGLVISYHGNSVAVERADGQVFQCHLRRNQALPVVGDRVHWQAESSEQGVITEILPRRTLLSRGDQRGQLKPLAANIDAIIIVMAPPPVFSEYLVDRYLVAAELLNIAPILVLNKVDLLNDKTSLEALNRLKPYQEIDYPVILSSVMRKNGLEDLNAYLQTKSAVLIGPSGVGKSSIIAALGDMDPAHALRTTPIRIGSVSAKGAGKHTTTFTRLYHLPGGGSLIDSPGVRDFSLWPISRQDVLRGFKEFKNFANDCRFRDCLHLAEPGCAVQAAMKSGKISPYRYNSYQTLIKETKI